jgi:DNA primase
LFQHDITYAVAALGTATTPHHFRRLVRYTDTIIFCFDGDAAGRTAAFRALQVIFPLMQDHLQVRFLFLPEGEDPDTLIRKEGKSNFEKRLVSALPLSAFFFQNMRAQCDMTTMEGRARFAASALGYIQQLPEGIFAGILLEELAKLARVDLMHLKKQLHTIQATRPRSASSQAGAAAQAGDMPITAMGVSGVAALQSHPKLKAPMRAAMALLVQNPELAHLVAGPLPEGRLLGHAFLQRLIDLIKQLSIPNTARLIEYWRGQKEERFIASLACVKLAIPENGAAKEFLGTLRQIQLLDIEEKINDLMAKGDSLSEEEKQVLSAWIIKKQSLQLVPIG